MQLVRSATEADLMQIRALWSARFGDSESFMDWFFSERYDPSLASCFEIDGKIVSALQSLPLHVCVRGRVLPASMMSGVSTDPAYEGHGYMRQTFLYNMRRVRNAGIPIVIHTPSHMSTYFSRGHFPATDTQYLTIEVAHAAALPENICEQSLHKGLAPLQACYQQAFYGYSGIVSRSLADFAFKFRDYASDSARCYALWSDNAMRGYCVFFEEANRLHAEEIAATDDAAYATLLDALCCAADGRNLHAKLPPQLVCRRPDAHTEIHPQGAMGVANISALLAALLGDGSLRFQVLDASVPENAGVWNGAGRSDGDAPHFAIEAGRLGQLLCGYAGADALAAAGQLAVYDRGALQTLSAALPKLPCYIVDEY